MAGPGVLEKEAKLMRKLIPAAALVFWLMGPGSLPAQEASGKPLGKWERKIGKNQVTLLVEENRLHVTVMGEKPCTIHADWCLTRDQIVYGVVTSVECEEDEHASEKEMLDAPFSCRFRIDEGVLIVRDLKMAGGDNKEDLWGGRFKAVPTTPPVAAPPRPVNSLSPAGSSSSGLAPNSPFNWYGSFMR
jgi:hypothetical protein